MTNLQIVSALIVIMGLLTVFLSIYVAASFYGHSKRMTGGGMILTKSLTYQLFAEGILGLGTLAFAIAAMTGHLEFIHESYTYSARAIMFFSTSITTLHLYHVVNKLHSSDG